jgi:hypothetical protein
MAVASSAPITGIELYWLPLGAGGHSVRLNGLVFEALVARLQHRDRCDLYHSALEVYVPEGRFVIEQAPAWGESGERGVVAEGPVGTRAAGRFRLFATRCGAGAMASFPMSPRPSTARAASATTLTARGGCSS